MGFSSRYVLPSSQRQTLRAKDKPPAKRRPLTLTRKQELFVKELITKDGTITQREAAINAGYSPKTASAIASNMLNPNVYPHVYQEYMRQKRELDSKYAVRKDFKAQDSSGYADTGVVKKCIGEGLEHIAGHKGFKSVRFQKLLMHC